MIAGSLGIDPGSLTFSQSSAYSTGISLDHCGNSHTSSAFSTRKRQIPLGLKIIKQNDIILLLLKPNWIIDEQIEGGQCVSHETEMVWYGRNIA